MNERKYTKQLGQWLAGSENSEVYFCDQNQVVTICLHCITLRVEVGAFRELLGMLGYAQSQIERINKLPPGFDAADQASPCDGPLH